MKLFLNNIRMFSVFLLLNIVAIAQTNNLPLVAELESEDALVKFNAIAIILTDTLFDYVPYLEENIFIQSEPYTIKLYLDALNKLNSPNIIEITYAYIDSANKFSNMFPPVDPLESKVRAVKILFDKGDTTRANIVFELIDRDKPNISLVGLIPDLLNYIINNIPGLKSKAKEELLYLSRNWNDDLGRSFCQLYLYENFGSEYQEEFIEKFKFDESLHNRIKGMQYLFKINYSELNTLLRERLNEESEPSLRLFITDSLLFSFGSPADYEFVKNHLVNETEPAIKKMMEETIDGYEPTPPKEHSTTLEYIDYAYSLCDTLIEYTWLGDIQFKDELQAILQSAKTNLQNGDSLACRVQVQAFQDLVDNVYKDSLNTDPRFVTIEGWKFLYWNAQYILDRLPEPQTNPNLVVNLKNSLGNQIPASNVKYYDTSWKDAIDNGDGTFTVITTKPTVSIRVFYEYANQTVNNVPAQNNTYTFTTVNAAVQLKNSLGSLIDAGTVQYYAGAWRSFGTTSNGVANKELLPVNYSFRMTYEFGSIDKQQNLSVDPTVVFQTVNAAVQLKNSLGNLIDLGTVQYYAGAWRNFGTTSNGVATKELLPVNYSFRMTHEFVSNDKQQNLSTNPVVEFSTVLCSIRVSRTSNNQPINNAAVKYYSVAWRDIGQTNAEGIVTKELLPKNLSFRAILGNVSQDKQQDIGVNNMVEIQLNTQ
jgi:hypothetical protein